MKGSKIHLVSIHKKVHSKLGTYFDNMRFVFNFYVNILEIMKKGKPVSTSGKFNAAAFVKPGLSEEEVLEIKKAFDLFDTDQGGIVDSRGTK